jgi:hypothetical protein
MMVGGLAAGAAVRTFPFRVFSFPSEISIPLTDRILLTEQSAFGVDLDPTMKGLGDFIIQPQWDFYQVAAGSLVRKMPLFNLPRDTDHGPRVTEL